MNTFKIGLLNAEDVHIQQGNPTQFFLRSPPGVYKKQVYVPSNQQPTLISVLEATSLVQNHQGIGVVNASQNSSNGLWPIKLVDPHAPLTPSMAAGYGVTIVVISSVPTG
eukprot:GILI01004160.1.p1 GENE.GILI01004160.1~~GILI01004160.1.p1  ORF type:complete len:121 (-),score=15.21 GILI01004160.1:245-574(-)